LSPLPIPLGDEMRKTGFKKEKCVLKNVITINGVAYQGEVKGSPDLISYLKYLDEKINWEREKVKSSERHPEIGIGTIRG